MIIQSVTKALTEVKQFILIFVRWNYKLTEAGLHKSRNFHKINPFLPESDL